MFLFSFCVVFATLIAGYCLAVKYRGTQSSETSFFRILTIFLIISFIVAFINNKSDQEDNKPQKSYEYQSR